MTKTTSRLARITSALVVGGILLLTGGAADADRVTWKMQSTIPKTVPVVGEAGAYIAEQIQKISGGEFKLRYYDPGALVPAFEAFDAVKQGSVDAAYGVSAYWSGKLPAAALFTTYPFGPSADEYMAWLYFGDGQKLWDELYAPHGVKGLPCGIIGPEGSGWYRKEIKTLDDLKGLKIRIGGIGGRVFNMLGASTQMIPGGDIYPALERGTIDAAEFALPVTDLGLGFYQVAKNYYPTGWHQPSTIWELLVNLEKWNALDDGQRAIVEQVCKATTAHTIGQSYAINGAALDELQKKGVTLQTWPADIMAAFRKTTELALEKAAADDPFTKKVLDNIVAFRKDYKRYYDLGTAPQ